MSRRALVFAIPLIGALLFMTADAAGAVGQLTVSNPAPTPGATIMVTSTGLAGGHEVTIALSGAKRTLARVAADASGVVHARVIVPSDVALDLNTLSVTGTAASGVPQQIVTGLTVHRIGPGRAPARPWTAVLVLVAIAAALLLLSLTVVKPVATPRRLAQS